MKVKVVLNIESPTYGRISKFILKKDKAVDQIYLQAVGLQTMVKHPIL